MRARSWVLGALLGCLTLLAAYLTFVGWLVDDMHRMEPEGVAGPLDGWGATAGGVVLTLALAFVTVRTVRRGR